jgi:hypothetical protein
MDTGIINRKAYEFYTMLEVMPFHSMIPPENIGTRVGENPVYNIGEVENLQIIKSDPSGDTISLFYPVENEFVGLPEVKYKLFKGFISTIQEMQVFEEKTTQSFLELNTFDWLIKAFKKKKVEQDIIAYLLDRVKRDYREYIFYFRLKPLILETKFRIGGAEITHLTKEFLKEEEEKFLRVGKSKKDFDEFISNFSNYALLKVTASGVEERAKEGAMKIGELAASVLKCFLHDVSIYGQYKIPDIDHRVMKKEPSPYFYHCSTLESHLIAVIMNKGDLIPVEINELKLQQFKTMGLELFSKFIVNKKDNEVYVATTNAIKLFGEIVSTRNKYEKIVKLISLFEAILIDQRKKNGGGEMLLTKKLLPQLLLTSTDIQTGVELGHNFYRIRNMYVHHGKELPVDYSKLYQFQTITFTFLTYMIRRCEICENWDAFFNVLNQ